jgi:hypothetical protein
MTSSLKNAQTCVGESVDIVASAFGKHVHPTGHCAPIIDPFGRGYPELV